MDIEMFDEHRRRLTTPAGPISYVDIGQGPRTVVFIHGVGTSGYLWRNVIEQLVSRAVNSL